MSKPFPQHLRSGKVRDLYSYQDELWLVASDRISAYDVVLKSTIPEKGKILTQLSYFWFQKLAHVCPHHVISCILPDHLQESHQSWNGRLMRCKKTEVIPMECVVRGYLAGSAWDEYRLYNTVGGHPLPKGLKRYQQLPAPLFTPAKKNEHGHDENLTELDARKLVGNSLYERLHHYSLDLYTKASDHLARCSLILADTKFEFGLIDNQIIWIDEALTPDSSRYWERENESTSEEPQSYDKQSVRDYLKTLKGNWAAAPVELPESIIQETRKRYVTAWEKITGIPWG